MKNKQIIGGAVLSGILCATSYPPFPAWALFFCFAPLWIVWWNTSSLKKVFLAGLITQFILTLIGFYWVGHTVKVFGHIPFPANILVLFGFCLIANLHVPFSGWILRFIHNKHPFSLPEFFITAALLHGVLELIMPAVFPWNLGYGLLYSHFNTAQLAEFFGFNLLSVFVLLMNALFAISYLRYPQKKWHKPLMVFAGILVVTEILGVVTKARLPAPDKSVKILLAQSNINNFEEYYYKYGNQYPTVVTDKLINQATELLKTEAKPDFLVWPENAFPDTLDPYFMGRPNPQKLFKFLKENQLNLLTGGFSQDFAGTRMMKDYSAVFAYDFSAQLKGLYRKHILLAFGEYIPGASYFSSLKKLIPEIGDVGRGPGPQAMTVGNISFSPVICYEAIHSDYVTASSNLGSHILFNATIDSWYGNYSEQWQHLIMSVGRSIELRKPLVRVTNTGFSAVSDVTGNIVARSPLFEEWGKTVEVKYYSEPPRTIYSRIYSVIPNMLLILVAGMVLRHITRHASKRN